MIEFLVKETYKFRRDLEDDDFRRFAQELARKWTDYQALVPNKVNYWMRVQETIRSALLWNIINAKFAHDLAEWLKDSKFVGQVPSDVAQEFEARYSVDPHYFRLLPKFLPKRYSLEQFFIYKEVCNAFGLAPYAQDVK